MNLRRFVAVMALAWAGCSSSNPMDDWVCACESSITFALSRPLAGVPIRISVEEPDGNVEVLNCQPSGNVLACLPLSSNLMPNFDPLGALQSVTLNQPLSGAHTVELVIDGAVMGGGTFPYTPSSMPIYGACGQEGTCLGGALTYTIEGN